MDLVEQIQPLSQTQIGIIKIVKSAMKSTKETLPDGFDWKEAQIIIDYHSIEGLAYFGLKKMGLDIPDWLKFSFLRKSAFLTQLWSAADTVMNAFENAGVEYIPLKGIAMKDRYPDKYMRYMSDVDILIHENEYEERIKPIMKNLGWKEGTESDHEFHWIKDGLMLELHKRIIPSYNTDYYAEVGDGWEWMREHSMDEYNFIHFSKHYRDGGIGIGHLCDLVFLENFSGLGLDEFWVNVKNTLGVWFDDAVSDDKTNLISSTVFSSGKYGTIENRMSASDAKSIVYANGNCKKASAKKRLRLLFPSWKSWKIRNPILKKVPILLPILWLERAILLPWKRSSKRVIKTFFLGIDDQSDYLSQMKHVGLEFKK